MLVKKETSKRKYELTYLVGCGYTTAEMNAINDAVIAMIGKNSGEILETHDWGKKFLAYEIKKEGKKYNEAIYAHLVINLPAKKALNLARDVNLKKEILRSLLVVSK